jgi:hypothetical protein
MRSPLLRSLSGFGLPLLMAALAGPGAAQNGAQTNALGGAFVSRGMSRPLGGVTPPSTARPGQPGARSRSNRSSVAVLPFGYATYVPNYFDSFAQDPYPASAYPPPPPALYQGSQAPTPPPVVINQYFTNQAPIQPDSQRYAPADQPADASDQKPGDPLGQTQNFYLIAYKNHTIYTALAYWMEGGTFNYVTTENKHNQASLDLIDLDLTKSLNQSRNVPFSLSGN